ncbi:transposon Tf2-6 polyprotein [Trichonephila clavata]|uniref:Transposon Tf2-6 polyprotein n=1 Tax=Trichonephila clavata TaxID=2740835 RepID=A0A8X6J4A0_TRICU|nr:transposon Tf2-6 polyprotein [Trichonephila clavata]
MAFLNRASVSVPIIGADFLYHFNISPDLCNRKLIDNATKLSVICKLVSPKVHSIKLVSGESIFHDVLREFPEIVQPPSFSQETRLPPPAIKPMSHFYAKKMRALQPTPTSAHSNSSMFVPTNLKSYSHVFLRIDSVQPPLSQNYTGPHEVIHRTDKVFTILINGKKKAVSIDRVKPAYVWNDTEDIPLTGISKQQASETDQHPKDKTMFHINKTESQSNKKNVKQTRSGRHVRFPKDLWNTI